MVSTAQATERIPPDNSRVRGRPFANGNPGRKPGSRNRATMITHAVSDKDREELIEKGLALAKQGDASMLKFFLERIVPREWHVRFKLPDIKNHQDVVKALAIIIKAVSEGEISPATANDLTAMVANINRCLEDAEFEADIEAKIEQSLEIGEKEADDLEKRVKTLCSNHS